MNAHSRTRSRLAARSRSSQVRAFAIVTTTSAILLWAAAWVALGLAAIQEVGA